MNTELLLAALGLFAVFFPTVAAGSIVTAWVIGLPMPEHWVQRIVRTTFSLVLIACLILSGLVITGLHVSNEVMLTHWLVAPSYVIDARLVFDLPGVAMMTLIALLCGLIGVFSGNYLHKDPGFYRFFVLLMLFATGMMAVAVGDTLDIVFAGWEVVGLSSALLIAYFTYREAPVRHGLRAFAVYRVCDVALLSAAVLLHHYAGEVSLAHAPPLAPEPGLLIALLLVFASMGKGASFPFTGWLPRAMEGPTPSSAIFYGALSIHAGPYLLLRAWPYLVNQPIARAAIIAIGAVTAIHATFVGRVQTDIKTSLGYAAVTQAAIIMIEIGLGWTMIATLHIFGHAILRTTQLLRAPSVLHDWHELTARLGGPPPKLLHLWERALPVKLRRWAYRVSLERWFIDDLGGSVVFAALLKVLHGINRIDERLMTAIAGPTSPLDDQSRGGEA